MLKVGLTGSIAVGKSFVCEVFRELGCFVLDADQVAREVVEPGTVGLRTVVDNFGPAVLKSNGELDRAKLGAVDFSDEENRLLLNSIVHPLVFEVQNRWLAECEQKEPNGIAIVDAALMIESGGYRRFERLIVVWCEPAIQLERLILRDNLSHNDALVRISVQMTQEEKKQHADLLIDTSNGYEDTRSQVVGVYNRLRLLADAGDQSS
jgi:dephospho-CoA kinase